VGVQSGVVVSALEFSSEGQWFDAQSLPLCCFLRQETSPHIASHHPGYKMGSSDILPGVTLQWTGIPFGGRGEGVAVLSVASCYRNREKLQPCGPPWLMCDFTY